MVAPSGFQNLYLALFLIGLKQANTLEVEGSDITPIRETFSVSETNSPIKIACNFVKENVEYITWQYKRCGFGLSVISCEELPANAEWQFVQCRNNTKLCTGGSLTIENPSEINSGLYRCLLKMPKNSAFRVHSIVQLDVYDPRATTIEGLNEEHDIIRTVGENEGFTLECNVRSVNYPYFLWTKSLPLGFSDSNQEDEPIYQMLGNGETYKGFNKTYSSKLFLPNIGRSDGGVYTCYAVNDRQKLSKQMILKVTFQESSFKGYEIWWVVLALAFSAKTCILVLWFLFQRRRTKTISDESTSNDPHPLLPYQW